MRLPEKELDSEALEGLHEDEERALLDNPSVPDDVKSELAERLVTIPDELPPEDDDL